MSKILNTLFFGLISAVMCFMFVMGVQELQTKYEAERQLEKRLTMAKIKYYNK